MPTTVFACLLAIALASGVALLTPVLLRWLPVPADEEDVAPFSELDSPRFRWAVFGTAAVAGCLALGLTEPAFWAAWAPYASLGALLALIDLRTTFLPTRLVYLVLGLAFAGAVLAAWLVGDWGPLLWAAIGGLAAAALFWVVWRVSGDRLGYGDIRLAGLIGVVAGSGGGIPVVWSFLLGSVAGAIWGIASSLRRGADGPFPYGPPLMLGPLLALMLQPLVAR
ncbi:MAG: prepilin peptidase [Propionibacteriaceae bacterium]|nr:prepilin peptidase [Propionibacteriaceae bacterium]